MERNYLPNGHVQTQSQIGLGGHINFPSITPCHHSSFLHIDISWTVVQGLVWVCRTRECGSQISDYKDTEGPCSKLWNLWCLCTEATLLRGSSQLVSKQCRDAEAGLFWEVQSGGHHSERQHLQGCLHLPEEVLAQCKKPFPQRQILKKITGNQLPYYVCEVVNNHWGQQIKSNSFKGKSGLWDVHKAFLKLQTCSWQSRMPVHAQGCAHT